MGLYGLEDPHRSDKGIAMSRSGEVPGTPAPIDPRRYHESVADERSEVARRPPVCLYLEVTNRCNLLCTTCPRTYEELEPPADLSWDLFTSIVDQVPDLVRAVLHGVGEPMLVANLPRMVRYLKERGVYVLFNTNGTVLSERNGRALIDAGLDERQTARASRRSAAGTISAASSATSARFASCRSGKGTTARRFPFGSLASGRLSSSSRHLCKLPPRSVSGRSICNGSCFLRNQPLATRGPIRRCSSA